jgi:hypothetical protein
VSKHTSSQYDSVRNSCRDLFMKKMKDYGTAWRILRPPSLTDQIFIKAQRIRSIEQKAVSKVGEGIEPEYVGIINYCVMAVINCRVPETKELTTEEVQDLYDSIFQEIKDLMEAKNHDYGEAWRDMRIPTFTDLILMKILRIREIEDNAGQTLVSEGIEANFMDMCNYAVFALIRLSEQEKIKVK